jgi:hypothetical protein
MRFLKRIAIQLLSLAPAAFAIAIFDGLRHPNAELCGTGIFGMFFWYAHYKTVKELDKVEEELAELKGKMA